MSARHTAPKIRTDWFRILIDLQRLGMPNALVCKVLDVPHSTLRYWKQGGEPSHFAGDALLELWCEVTEQSPKERPRTFD